MPKKPSWIEISSPVRSESAQGIYSAAYHLSELVRRGAVSPAKARLFRSRTRLGDFYWRTFWARGDLILAGGRQVYPRKTDVVVVFMHGWDGSNAIWESLPARVCAAARNTLVLVPDVNGFGRSPFEKPAQIGFSDCDPKAVMRAVEGWLQLLGFLGGRRHTPIVFVGHSMSGAALFYFSPTKWSNHITGHCAIAPALLMNDILRKGFYQAMGVSIWAGSSLMLDKLSDSVSPAVITQLISGASKAVKAEHERSFKHTHKSTLAHTFYAMGQAQWPPANDQWERFKVLLGNSDRLVGLSPMLNLLTEMGCPSRQIKVVLGDHYFFSVGRHSRKLHHEGREIAVEAIVELIDQCRR